MVNFPQVTEVNATKLYRSLQHWTHNSN